MSYTVTGNVAVVSGEDESNRHNYYELRTTNYELQTIIKHCNKNRNYRGTFTRREYSVDFGRRRRGAS